MKDTGNVYQIIGYTDAHPVVNFTGGSVTYGNGSTVAANSIQLSYTGGITTLYINGFSSVGPAQLVVNLTGEYKPINFLLSGSLISFVVPPPTNVVAHPGPGLVSLTFYPSSEPGLIKYTATCTSTTPGATSPVSNTGYQSPVTVKGLTPGASYACSVAASDASNQSSVSVAASNGEVVPAPLPIPSNPIPALSEWAQMAMMLIMLVTAGWYGRKMKQQ